jgi:hypothetical protein
VLPDQLYDLLEKHRAEQERERERAADLWAGEDWMFAQPNGRAIDPRRDMDEWKALLTEAVYGTPGYTTPDTPPRRCCCSWKCRNGP